MLMTGLPIRSAGISLVKRCAVKLQRVTGSSASIRLPDTSGATTVLAVRGSAHRMSASAGQPSNSDQHASFLCRWSSSTSSRISSGSCARLSAAREY
jgi:hypothetical protein